MKMKHLNYITTQILGEGSFGVVSEAIDRGCRLVAIKEVDSNSYYNEVSTSHN